MKKCLLIAFVTIVLALTLCACTVNINVGQADYDNLTQKLSSDYSGWTLNITTTKGDVTLTNNFVITKQENQTKIEYSVESLNEISFDSDNSFKAIKTGTAYVTDGSVTSIDGDDILLTPEEFTSVGLTFKADYFSNVIASDSSFSATVKNPSGFLGKDISCSDMKINATYGDKFKSIQIAYTAEDGAKVVYDYSFVA